MIDADFTISDKQWARREFPKRLVEAASRHYKLDEDNRYGINALIADDAGVHRSAVTRWLKGAVPSVDTIIKLADAYGVAPDYLVGNDSAPAEGFRLDDVEARIPYAKLTQVLRIMSELRKKAGEEVSDDWFARATVEVLKIAEREPGISEDAIIGAAYRLLKNGPTD